MLTLDEFITTEINASGNTVAFGKVIKGITKDKQCPLNYFVINWFVFNEFYQITEFSAVFNLTQVIEQRNCWNPTCDQQINFLKASSAQSIDGGRWIYCIARNILLCLV